VLALALPPCRPRVKAASRVPTHYDGSARQSGLPTCTDGRFQKVTRTNIYSIPHIPIRTYTLLLIYLNKHIVYLLYNRSIIYLHGHILILLHTFIIIYLNRHILHLSYPYPNIYIFDYIHKHTYNVFIV